MRRSSLASLRPPESGRLLRRRAAGHPGHHGQPGARVRRGQPAADRDRRAAVRLHLRGLRHSRAGVRAGVRGAVVAVGRRQHQRSDGHPPAGTTSFSYTVTATNVAGEATAGPFTVTVTKAATNANISAVLRCPASITAGGTGTCTLTVANAGPATASNVTAAIVLPAALSETPCSSGCARHGNVYTWTQSSLGDGASAQFSITVKASRACLATVLAVAASQSPDRKPLNNISLQLITIKR